MLLFPEKNKHFLRRSFLDIRGDYGRFGTADPGGEMRCPGADVEALSGFSEYSDDVFHFHYEESVIALEIDWDGSFGIKEHFVILS